MHSSSIILNSLFCLTDDLLNHPDRKLFRPLSDFPSAVLGHDGQNDNRQLILTACSVLKLLLSHSGHRGPVVSY